MDEEAGFIAALLADPDDETVLLVYADWLDERDDPRGEYLRLLVADRLTNDMAHFIELVARIERRWLDLIHTRNLRVGTLVQVTLLARPSRPVDFPHARRVGRITEIAPDRSVAVVESTDVLGRPFEREVPMIQLKAVER